jgi:MOSC domain-containing protein YiiM
MKTVSLPADELPALQRSVAACLASILEIDVAAVPLPAAGHPQPWTVWRNWLAQRGLGLVPVSHPDSFAWPGPWLAVLHSEQHAGDIVAVAFGAPPGLAWNPLAGTETFDAVHTGFVVAPADVALWTQRDQVPARQHGRVEVIAIAPAAEAPMRIVEQATAHAGRGLEGDRYVTGGGTFSNMHARGHDLTLIEAEALEELVLPEGPLAPEAARRNVVTRGIDLNALVGKRFRIGDVDCLGQRLCEPCARLERLTRPGTLRALVHRGGLRADVLTDGVIRLGDALHAR